MQLQLQLQPKPSNTSNAKGSWVVVLVDSAGHQAEPKPRRDIPKPVLTACPAGIHAKSSFMPLEPPPSRNRYISVTRIIKATPGNSKKQTVKCEGDMAARVQL